MPSTDDEIGGLHEHTANAVIADWLRSTGRGWRPNPERKRVFVDSARRADIIIRQPNRQPVVIETEFGSPAVADAAGRLGLKLRRHQHPIREVIAVGIDQRCERDETWRLKERLERNEPIFSVQIVRGAHEAEAEVWPTQPLRATPFDLVAYCEYAQAPQIVIDEQSKEIAEEIETTASLLRAVLADGKSRGAGVMAEFRKITGSDDDDGALNNVCATWLVAIDLQNDLARHNDMLQHEGLLTAEEMREQNGDGVLAPLALLNAWRSIKSVNYEPVMNLAIATLSVQGIDIEIAPVLRRLSELSVRIDGLNVKHIYNFAGELWQHLIVDREERAAHYTKPAVAELLATLSAQRFADRDAGSIAELNLWDAACGTGTLLGAGERALRRLYVQAGGDPRAPLHKQRMEHRIFAMDVNSIAGTLTAKRLTDLDVEQSYQRSNIAVVDHEAGSLYLLDPEQTTATNLLGQGATATTPGADEQPGQIAIPFGGMDWALMNPPYARARGGRVQPTTGLGPLRQRARKFGKQQETRGYEMANGQAGLATFFGDISNMRLRGGGGTQGVFAHVLPLTAAHGETWQAWRAELETDFEDIVAIANAAQDEESMSADTGMNEILVVATKKARRPRAWSPCRITAVALEHPPLTLQQGYAIAREIAAIPPTSLSGSFGHGAYVRTETPSAGFSWLAVGNASTELSLVAAALVNGKYYDPLNLAEADLALGMVALSELAPTGPTHHLLGHPEGKTPIGAFEWRKLTAARPLPTHVSMWAADGDAQRRMILRPTHRGTPMGGDKVKEEIKKLNEKRSCWFFSRNLDQASQALSVAHTRSPAHGGRSWNALQVADDAVGKAIALFYNSIFGAIVRHAYGQNTQDRRAAMQIRATQGIPCPDFTADSDAARRALDIAEREFDRLAALELEPFGFCFQDPNRHEIDFAAAEMLGLDPADGQISELLARYRLLFAREPNVNGRKRAILDALAEYE